MPYLLKFLWENITSTTYTPTHSKKDDFFSLVSQKIAVKCHAGCSVRVYEVKSIYL